MALVDWRELFPNNGNRAVLCCTSALHSQAVVTFRFLKDYPFLEKYNKTRSIGESSFKQLKQGDLDSSRSSPLQDGLGGGE